MGMATPMTQEGLEKLKAELAELEARRPVILLAIKEAREKGDLSENAEYHAAREELAMTEEKITDLRYKISQAVIVDKTKIGGDAIVFGATVKLLDMATKDEEEYTLVGEGEADPLANRILTTSPMGQALLTHKVGDVVEVPVPKGKLKFKVLEIRFG
ncbi:MAG: transcription elongation factor GreA [Planctomycetota bacterium]|nr:transcription elongation factor GreA [Planctomycetota bacterium]